MTGYVKEHDRIPFAQKSRKKPLEGVRIIDAGNMVAAPYTTVLLADFGANVIKIEHPKNGDGQRKLEPIKDGVPLWWKAIARNKRCITLDLSKPKGAAVLKDLTKPADVVAENYRPGTLERWGLGYDVLKAVNSRIILLRISGFGQTGPQRDRPGFGRIAEAMSGLTNLIGDPDGPPMSPGYPIGDLVAGMFGAFAIMMALYHRDLRQGEGQVIDLALYESVFRLLDFDPIQVSGPFYFDPFPLLAERGVAVPFFHYGMAGRMWGELYPNYGEEHMFGRILTPMEEMARFVMYNSWAGLGHRWLNDTLRVARDLKVNGIVNFIQVGCTAISGLNTLLAENSERELGIPTLNIEGRMLDATFFDQSEFETRMDVFIDSCLDRKAAV